jgi:hypothetical protein
MDHKKATDPNQPWWWDLSSPELGLIEKEYLHRRVDLTLAICDR